MDSPAIKKYEKLRASLAALGGSKREKAEQDLKVLEDIIRSKHPGYAFDADDRNQQELQGLAQDIKARQDRLEKADAWFADPANQGNPRFSEFGRVADQISRELGQLTGRARELGWFWDGACLIPWADAFNPAAVASRPPNPSVVEDAAKALQGRIIEPLTPPAQPAGGSFSGTTQVQDLSDYE